MMKQSYDSEKFFFTKKKKEKKRNHTKKKKIKQTNKINSVYPKLGTFTGKPESNCGNKNVFWTLSLSKPFLD